MKIKLDEQAELVCETLSEICRHWFSDEYHAMQFSQSYTYELEGLYGIRLFQRELAIKIEEEVAERGGWDNLETKLEELAEGVVSEMFRLIIVEQPNIHDLKNGVYAYVRKLLT